MNMEIKKTVKAGNSSAVILPRAWLNQEVRVELVKKSQETILFETINIAKKYMELKDAIGIYLAGSYARGEESKDSDIDILIISNNIDKEMVHEGIYNVLIISEELLNQKLKQDLFPIGQMIKEAKPLINSSYLNSIDIIVTKKNVKWYIDTTNKKLKLLKNLIKKSDEKVNNRIIYTLILRIRTLHIIQKLINNENYSKKDFISLIEKISSRNSYESYLEVKNELKETNKITKKEAEELYNYLEKQLESVKKVLKY